MTHEQLITSDQLAEELSLHPVTLAQWRMTDGKGPRFIKVGASVRYRRSDVDEWLDANMCWCGYPFRDREQR